MRALRTIKANGQWYEPGDTLPDLGEADRRHLLEVGAAAEDAGGEDSPADSPSPEQGGEADADEGDVAEDLLEAARELAEEYAAGTHDAEQWTGAGVPGTAVLGERVGRKVTAAERDAAWSAVQEA
ncbi:MAG: hypothetical protein ACLFVF_06840 [Thiohalospira sp.]